MKANLWLSSVVLIAAALAGGCASSPMSRIDANRGAYESWPVDVQEAVLNGQAKKGMTREQVEMALGKPSEVVSRSSTDEIWVYKKSGGVAPLLNNTGISVGTGIGGVGVGTTMGVPGSRSGASEDKEVVFENGVVVRAD